MREPFLKSMPNSNLNWTLILRDNQEVSGSVYGISYKVDGEPLTLLFGLTEDDLIDIPWNAIQTIKPGM